MFFDIDIYSQYQQVSNYEEFISVLKLNGYKLEQKNFFYVFLDEFQRYKDLSLVIKNIYDHHPNIKIYATSSSSLMIKNAIQDSLAGRKFISYLYPLSFEEVLIFQNRDKELDTLKNLRQGELTISNLQSTCKSLFQVLEEILIYGSYPELVLNEKPKTKEKILSSIFDLYIRKDIRDYLQVENIDAIRKLVDLLAVNNAKELKYSSFTAALGIDDKIIKNYVEILKESFLLSF